MGLFGDIGDGINKGLGYGEHLVDEGKKKVGEGVDWATNKVGDGLDHVGLHDWADTVEDWGDGVASDLGATPGEQQLGQTEEANELVHGDPGKIGESAKHLTDFHTAFDKVSSGLKKIDSSGWKGEGGDAFREKFGVHPAKWAEASAACEAAAGALGAYAHTVTWAQGQAKEAVALYKKGVQASKDASDAYNKKVEAYNAKIDANQDPGPKPDPFVDPGKADVKAAREKLAEARKQRNTAASEAQGKIKAALAHAPAEPPPLSRLRNDFTDGFQAANIELAHFDGGILKGTAGLVTFARGLNPMDPYNLTHPAAYAQNVSMTLSGLVSTAAHPERMVEAAVDGFTKDPSEFLGRLVPQLIGTDGAGLAAGGLRLGLKTAVKEGLEDGAESAARTAVKDGAEDVARREGEKVCAKDPVDVATGRMVLPATDVSLPGVLPLVLSRQFESSYRLGGWFGPTWSSTLDQRLEIDAEGVLLLGEDGLVLAYPHPAPGVPTLPSHGPRRPLDRVDGGYTVTDPATGVTWHFEDLSDRLAVLAQLDDRNGNWITFGHDAEGTPDSVTHSAGHRLVITTEDGRVTAVRLAGAGADGHDQELLRYGYTGGHLTEVTGSSGLPTRFGYDERGRVVSWTDTNDSHFTYVYDEQDRCTHQEGAAGHLRSDFAYGPVDASTGEHTTTITDSLGHSTRYLINGRCQVIAETDPLGGTTRYQRDRHNRLLAHTDALGATTTFRYDGTGNLLTLTRPDGCETTAEYNALGLPTKIRHTDGTIVRQDFDASGNRTSLTGPEGQTTRFAYDTAGHLASVTDPLGNTTTITCDRAGLPLRVTDPLGATTRYERDAFGRPTTITDPTGATTLLAWTVEGRLAHRTAPDGASESWTYDGEGNCTGHTDPLGGVTTYEYTHFDLLTARTAPDGVRHTFGHDTELRLTTVTNPQGLVWSYTYDAAGRLTGETDFDGRHLAYSRDAVGRLTARVDALSQTTTFAYNALGQVVSRNAAGRVTTYSYDFTDELAQATGPDGSTLTVLRDRYGRVREEVVDGRRMTYSYDRAGRRAGRRTPSGATTTWSYDAAGRRDRMLASGRAVDFLYDGAGNELTRSIDATLTLEQTFDSLGRLTNQNVGVQGRQVQRRAYTYRADGHLIGMHDSLSGPRSFDLDTAGRVMAVRAADWTETYAYDKAGNQTDGTWPAHHPHQDAVGIRSYTGTRITRAGDVRYEHDGLGRIVLRQRTRLSRKPDTWRYVWDAEDHLVLVVTPDGTRWQYRYDPLGRRTEKVRLGKDGKTVVEKVVFTWDGTTLCEQTTTSAELPHMVTLTWDHQGLHPLGQTERITAVDMPEDEIDSRFFAIVTDLVGTPSELVGEDGRIAWRSRATLWGTAAWAADSTTYTPLRFPGQYFDPETGLHYNYARHYDPTTARYASPDPLGLDAAPNPVAYVLNPHAWTDPLGLTPCPPRVKDGGWDVRGRNPLSVVPDDAEMRILKPDPNGGAQLGVEYKWKDPETGNTVRLRVHDRDGTAPAGSNAAKGDVYRLSIGGRYQDEAGNLYHRQVHNPNSPHYNPGAANSTHIPWPSQFPLPY
ncbi:putative T7SS-secreted protein [Streptomyces fuscigenes]|uniref:putative T7SS-secreted protein n=1 Tax=Streptomyces fuscigenes TaxID=1528880 RepID=UPI001F288CAE|nr:polymorphic toxin type 30 domain-containing protein [Streptomyces fuscigenes]MCF3960433.1 polymorphic toxin type 30 domain-containing protein [Streptomyces fuscigenes]